MAVFSSKEDLGQIFLDFSKAAMEEEPFFHLQSGLILPSCYCRWWEIAAILANFSLAWEEHLHHHLHHPQN
jgi:hypothetical protein